MLRYLLVLCLFFGTLFSSPILVVQKGWQLIGTPEDVEDLNVFSNKNVEIIWSFDAKEKKWRGFSPNSEIAEKITEGGYEKLSSIKKWHGVWIKSANDWSLELDKSNPTDLTQRGDKIDLEEGWNLISIPVNTVVSPKIFNDATIWKYNNGEWAFSDSNNSSVDFPPIENIQNSEGFWVNVDKKQEILVSDEESRLVNFNTIDEVQEYIKEIYFATRRDYFYIAEPYMMVLDDDAVETMAPSMDGSFSSSASSSSSASNADSSTDSKATDATTTNLQELNVDEADVLKHDGENIFFADSSQNRAYFTSFSKLASNDFNITGVVDIHKDYYINSFHILNNRLIVLSTGNSSSLVESFDISDVNNIKKVGSFSFDGYFTESRVVNSKLYLVSQFYPSIEYSYPKLYVDYDCSNQYYFGTKESDFLLYAKCAGVNYDYESKKYFRYDYDNPVIISEKFLPKLTDNLNNQSKDLLLPSKFYAPLKINQTSSITSILKFDLEELNFDTTVSFVGNAQSVYSSAKSLYITSGEYPMFYDFWNYQERTTIYKFSIGEDFDYKAKGGVDGRILNQFSLSEDDDILRIATTEGFSWGSDATKNQIFTLKENNGVLEIVGKLEGLGKEGETIQAVRFLGKRGYVVTFKRTDPFYTIDLSEPTNPKKVGELSISGYSSYLHPIDDNRLLSIGRETDSEGKNKGVMVELFDVSDFANPKLADKKIVTDDITVYSEAEYNHKAFIFRESDKRFGFPLSAYKYTINANPIDKSILNKREVSALPALTTSDEPMMITATPTLITADEPMVTVEPISILPEPMGYYQNYLKLYYVDNLSIKDSGELQHNSGDKFYAGQSRGLIYTFNAENYVAFFNGAGFISKKISLLGE